MNRNEFLATEVMQWEQRDWLGSLWWDNPLREEGVYERVMPYENWNPGESWPQTGMILRAMDEDFYMTVTQYWDHVGTRSIVVFRQWESDVRGEAEDADLQEAIVAAAARAKGWSNDESVG